MARITFTRDDGTIQYIEMDAITNEKLNEGMTITSHPMENGTKATDHVNPNPTAITLDCIVSETPTRAISNQNDGSIGERSAITTATLSTPPRRRGNPEAGPSPAREQSSIVEYKATVLNFPEAMNRVTNVYNLLRERMRAGQVFTIKTKVRTYEDMMISSIDTPINAERAIRMAIAFKEVSFVSSIEVDAKPAKQRAKKKDAPGPQATKAAAEVSTAKKVFNLSPEKLKEGISKFLTGGA